MLDLASMIRLQGLPGLSTPLGRKEKALRILVYLVLVLMILMRDSPRTGLPRRISEELKDKILWVEMPDRMLDLVNMTLQARWEDPNILLERRESLTLTLEYPVLELTTHRTE